jgi:two-component system KDP operon response regulator KdpE
MSGEAILVIDDEAQIRKLLRIVLTTQGFTVSEADTGGRGIAQVAASAPDLVILDLGLPDLDGKDVVRQIREWSRVPILVLSVRQAEAEKVEALDAGANDYVVKPFGSGELVARVRALLRTADGGTDRGASQSSFTVGDLVVDVARHEVRLAGAPVRLTRKEFDLLRVLAQNAGRILTHGQLLREVWGKAHENDTQYLRVFVSQLRRKLNDDPAEPRFILNEPGVGYRMLDSDLEPGSGR